MKNSPAANALIALVSACACSSVLAQVLPSPASVIPGSTSQVVARVQGAGGVPSEVGEAVLTYSGFLTLAGVPYTGAADLRFTFHAGPGDATLIGPTLELAGAQVDRGAFVCDLPVEIARLSQMRFVQLYVRDGASGKYVAILPRTALDQRSIAGAVSGPGGTETSGAFRGSTHQNGSAERSAQGSGARPRGQELGAMPASSGTTLTAPVTQPPAPDAVMDWECVGTTLFYLNGPVGIGTNAPVNARLGVVTESGGAIVASTSGPNARAIFGEANNQSGFSTGVYGFSASPNGRGVFGGAGAAGGATSGVYGNSASNAGSGVFGNASATSGATNGVQGASVSPNGRGVFGQASHTTGFNTGVYGFSPSNNGRGVFGGVSSTTGSTVGVYGNTNSTAGVGVVGRSNATSGESFGVQGFAASTTGRGVFGHASATSGEVFGVLGVVNSSMGRGVFGDSLAPLGINFGVYGRSGSNSGRGVHGVVTNTSGDTFGVSGQAASTGGTAVFGLSTASSGAAIGGYFQASSTNASGGYGLAQASSGLNYGVAGASNSSEGYGVFAFGRFGASGTKSFRIDHPMDPQNKYLAHYSAESPEVINFYSGTIILDGAGEAEVELPAYFVLINKDPRYSLTPVGAPMPMLHVSEEISGLAMAAGELAVTSAAAQGANPEAAHGLACSFRIAGGVPGAKVSWRVDAVRNDAWVRENGAPVEIEKIGLQRGTYQDPTLFGQDAGMGEREIFERRARSQP